MASGAANFDGYTPPYMKDVPVAVDPHVPSMEKAIGIAVNRRFR